MLVNYVHRTLNKHSYISHCCFTLQFPGQLSPDSSFASMGRARTDSDIKSHLVTEICNISDRAVTCAHQHHFRSTNPPFVDWYLVLKVCFIPSFPLQVFSQAVFEPTMAYRWMRMQGPISSGSITLDLVSWTSIVQIRQSSSPSRFYSAMAAGLMLWAFPLRAALQLHPDKNKHPKADTAFKLVSEVNLRPPVYSFQFHIDDYGNCILNWTSFLLSSLFRLEASVQIS